MKPIRPRVVAFVAAALLFPSGCGGDDATGPLSPCTGTIEVRAVSGTRPAFHWTPRCGLASIHVLAAPSNGGGDGNMWVLLSGKNLIGPGLRYGDHPIGTVTEIPARPVTTGIGYAVFFAAPGGDSPIATLSWRP